MSDTSSALQASISIDSPKSVESSGINSKFKTLKKKIRNKFRLSRTEDVKTLAQAVETLKRSDELLTSSTGDTKEFKNEFKELKETLESIINQNQILADVVKSVDSACPDPFKDPEKFSIYFAQRSLSSNRSFSEEDFDFTEGKEKINDNDNDNIIVCEDDVKKDNENEFKNEFKNALLRLQNLRSEEQRGFQIERENYESRLGQISFLQQEIEILRKQNSEHQIQLDFLAQKNNKKNENENENVKNENEILKDENEKLKTEIESFRNEIEKMKLNQEEELAKIEKELIDKQINNNTHNTDTNTDTDNDNNTYSHTNTDNDLITNQQLLSENDQLKNQLELTLLQLKSLQEISESQIEKDQQFREISEENVRLKIEFEEMRNELLKTERQICDLEKEPVTSIISLENESKTFDESAFKYIYLSNLILKFMQTPDQRPELSQIIITTLKTDQEHFLKAMESNQIHK